MANRGDSGENPAMAARKKALRGPSRRKGKAPRRILVIDVGGSHVKLQVGEHGKEQRFVSGPRMSAAAMVKKVRKRVAPEEFDAVSIGYPGLVVRGRIAAEPHNLGRGWVGYDFASALGKPVRMINDAAMQALGSYTGGRMLFLGLGTGLGAALVLDGVVEPMEIGHLSYKRDRTFEEYAGQRGLQRLGKKKWRKIVADIVTHLADALQADYIVLGGGNASVLRELPDRARLGDNSNAMIGGRRLWETATPLMLSPEYRARAAAGKK
jgi:predicted NBD/HSP70 family sugar kinase